MKRKEKKILKETRDEFYFYILRIKYIIQSVYFMENCSPWGFFRENLRKLGDSHGILWFVKFNFFFNSFFNNFALIL